MNKRFTYTLRTQIGPWVALPATVLEVTNYLQRGMPWRGESVWTVEWFAIALFIIGPLCAGAAAVDASRLSRPGNIHLVLATPQPWRPYLRAAAWCAGPVIGVHLVAVATGFVVGGVRYAEAGWGWLVVAALVQCAAIAWYAAAGSAIGRFTPPILAGIAGAGAGFAAIYLLGGGGGHGRFELFALGAATVSRLGLSYHGTYILAQAAVLALTAATLLLLPLRTRSGVRLPTAVGGAMAACAVAVIAAGPFVFPSDRLEAMPQPPTNCSETTPQVCLYTEHERFADSVEARVATLVEAARKGGYPQLIPAKIEEISRSYRVPRPDTAALEIPDDTYVSGKISLRETVTELVQPSHCEQLYTGDLPADAYWERQMSLEATWLHLAGVRVDVNDYPVPVEILTPQQVEDIKRHFARCDLDG
ncbi:hypothetical protein ACX6XY_21690 [Streptomyces sp. O3]